MGALIDKRRFEAILHEGPIKSAADAVRAAIVEEYRNDYKQGRFGLGTLKIKEGFIFMII